MSEVALQMGFALAVTGPHIGIHFLCSPTKTPRPLFLKPCLFYKFLVSFVLQTNNVSFRRTAGYVAGGNKRQISEDSFLYYGGCMKIIDGKRLEGAPPLFY